MELKKLLESQNWSDSQLSYDDAELITAIREKTKAPVKRVLANGKRSLWLNGLFFLAFGLIYLLLPNELTLLACLLICGCYLFVFLSVLLALQANPEPRLENNIKQVLEETLAFDETVNRFQCRNFSVILTVAYLGGSFLGLGVQGWNFAKLIEKWPVLIIFGIGTVAVYLFSRTRLFTKANRYFTPHYHNSKKFVKEQLEILNAIS
ncbi:hypothetical protein SAMN04490243_0887 [Robiginitalea myxolifaciens]|uniref:Uncharacterized protein n=1 Tax=Robiginitalea myxolifaciens TaxID=400055 RepID=A0A1I6FY14_9FLAO|nr:hypothetical protein [Robiginitalea myxolifaciens]SFR34790.1 hypothetical protein SAMN04490243_0887 [Robiginitalea myxolifaciens]